MRFHLIGIDDMQTPSFLDSIYICILVWIIYDRKRTMGIFLGLLYIAELSAMLYASVSVNRRLNFGPTCLVDHTPQDAIFLRYSFLRIISICQ